MGLRKPSKTKAPMEIGLQRPSETKAPMEMCFLMPSKTKAPMEMGFPKPLVVPLKKSNKISDDFSASKCGQFQY